MAQIRIRTAHAKEAGEISALCMRSKAHWGYDEAFLKACEHELTITPERIARGRVLVAIEGDDALVGMAAAEPMEVDGAFDLALLFIEPKAIRRGVGEKLFAAMVAHIAQEDARYLRIESDPFAAGFYVRLGARRIGDVPSATAPNRMLPLFEFEIL
jgi:predicted N-acetyltransferase YhbS